MKIVVFHPNLNAEHQAWAQLRLKGFSVLHASNPTDAWNILRMHGSSISLAVIHREDRAGNGEPGLELVSRFKADPVLSKLPYILTTVSWSGSDCARHQDGSGGANAYLTGAVDGNTLLKTVSALVGAAPGEVSLPPNAPPAFANPPPLFEPEPQVPTAMIELAGAPPPLPAQRDVEPEPKITQEIVEIRLEDDSPSTRDGEETYSGPPIIQTPPPIPATSSEEPAREMPYLFESTSRSTDLASVLAQPLGDAVVPGGSAQSPDIETLKKYLLLREQDVAALSVQLKSSRNRNLDLESALTVLAEKNTELEHQIKEKENRIQDLQKTNNEVRTEAARETEEIRFQLKMKADHARSLERKILEATGEIEKIRERVRVDIRKIRVREKELENRLELVKKDSEMMLSARETKIVELKRKIDTLEFNIDLLQEQYSREKDQLEQLRQKLNKASQAMRVAGGFLDEDDPSESRAIG